MALLISESDVRAILTMPLALEAVETSFRRLADGSAISHSRQRLRLIGKGFMHYMAASDAAAGYLGMKIYTFSPAGACFLLPLFNGQSGDLVALIEANYLGQMRTGAASGVATRVMAREDARVAAIIGTGSQARTQLEAVALSRKLDRVQAFSRDPERCALFSKEMTERIGVPVTPVSSAEEAVKGADIVTTSTTSVKPVLEGRWLRPGMHVNAIGVNFAEKSELDAEAVSRADVIVADSVEQSKIEAGELIQAFGSDTSRWAAVREISDVVSGKVPGRTNRDQITLFKSNGIAIEDVVVGGLIYERARELGMGRDVPMFEKIDRYQDGRTT